MDSQLQDVRMIPAQQTYPLRHSVLRSGYPKETARFTSDYDVWTFHLGAFKAGLLAGVASFKRHSSPHFAVGAQYQLRGMAVAPEHQGQGLGRALLTVAYPVICAAGCRLLWCNARVSALEFYRKQGFTVIGEQFNTPLAGPHYVMYRNI